MPHSFIVSAKRKIRPYREIFKDRAYSALRKFYFTQETPINRRIFIK